jgi:hypothetical protein
MASAAAKIEYAFGHPEYRGLVRHILRDLGHIHPDEVLAGIEYMIRIHHPAAGITDRNLLFVCFL